MRTFAPFGMGPTLTRALAALDHFLRIHGVGAARHRRAGHDPNGLTGRQDAVEHGAGGSSATTSSSRVPAGRHVVARDRVPVDGRVVRRRHVEGRAQIRREHAVACPVTATKLGRRGLG